MDVWFVKITDLPWHDPVTLFNHSLLGSQFVTVTAKQGMINLLNQSKQSNGLPGDTDYLACSMTCSIGLGSAFFPELPVTVSNVLSLSRKKTTLPTLVVV